MDDMMTGNPNPFAMPTDPSETEGLSASAGEPIDPQQTQIASRERLVEALRTVYDPEIPVNIYDLGLIYDMEIHASGNVDIQMTLTAPACPVAGEMPQMVADAVADADGVGEVTVTLTWEPPWSMEMMTEDAKMALGIM